VKIKLCIAVSYGQCRDLTGINVELTDDDLFGFRGFKQEVNSGLEQRRNVIP
jgi:hypothetical protein